MILNQINYWLALTDEVRLRCQCEDGEQRMNAVDSWPYQLVLRPTTPSIMCFDFLLIGIFLFFCHQWKCEYYRLYDGGEWSGGGVYGTFLLIRGKCMMSPLRLRPDPPRVASFRASHWNTLHPFMCIDVKFVHKTRHLLTLFVISTSFF